MDNKKNYRRSGISIVCYVLAGLMLIYTCYTAGSIVGQINEYYAGYGMKATASEYITYVIQNSITPLFNTVVLFMLGYILDAVRKNNPANYMTDEELADAKAAKKQAKEAKKLAKGEKAAVKAGHITGDEESVAADFASDLDKELKADNKKEDKSVKKDETDGKKSAETYVKKHDAGEKKSENKRTDENGQRNHEGSSNNNHYRKQGGNRNGNGSRRNNNQNRSRNEKKAEAPKETKGTKETKDSFEAVVSGEDNE